MKNNIPKLWNTAKVVLRGKVIAVHTLIKKKERFEINNLTLYLKELEKEEKNKSSVSKRKEIIKIKKEMNEIEARKTIQKINKIKIWFFFLKN